MTALYDGSDLPVVGSLEAEIAEGRTRMLKVCEAIDNGQTLAECAALVELECDAEWERGNLAEARVQELEARVQELEARPAEARVKACEEELAIERKARVIAQGRLSTIRSVLEARVVLMSTPQFEQLPPDQIEREKQSAREADEQALVYGQMTALDIERKNLFLHPAQTIVHWERSGRL